MLVDTRAARPPVPLALALCSGISNVRREALHLLRSRLQVLCALKVRGEGVRGHDYFLHVCIRACMHACMHTYMHIIQQTYMRTNFKHAYCPPPPGQLDKNERQASQFLMQCITDSALEAANS